MAGASAIRAGEAFWEMTVKDGTAKGLRAVQSKLAALGAAMTAQGGAMAGALSVVLGPIGAIGSALAGIGVGTVLTKAVQTFMGVSKAAKDAGFSIAGIDSSKADALTTAWDNFKAVITGIGFKIGESIAGPVTKAIQVLTDLAVTGFVLATNLKLVGEIIGSALSVGFETAKLTIMKVWFGIQNAASDTFSTISDTAQETFVFLGTLFAELFPQTTAALRGMATAAVQAWAIFENAGSAAFSVLSTVAKNFFEGFKAAAEVAFGIVMSKLSNTMQGAKTFAEVATQVGGQRAGFDIFGSLHKANQARLAERERLGVTRFGEQHFRSSEQGRLVANQEREIAAARDRLNASMDAVRRERERTLKQVRGGLGAVPGQSILGGAAGAFATAGAGLMGIGAGGGLKVSDPEVREAINKQTKVIENLAPGGVRAK